MRALSLLFLLAPLLAAQETRIDIAVAYPSTTMLYGVMDHTRITRDLEFDEILRSLSAESGLPDLEELLTQRLELKLKPDEVAALTDKLSRSSGGILDVTVSGPKILFVFEHPDLAALSRALKQALEAGVLTVPEAKDHYGTQVYALYYPPPAKEVNPGGMDFRINPMSNFFQNQDLWITVYANRYLVVGNNLTAVTDAIDFLAFPEDTADTLLSSARYREAIKEYKNPDALIYLSIESVITAMERVGGDKGNNPMIWQVLPWWLGVGVDYDEGQWGFYGRLLQYEQFKSAAAAMWIDESQSTIRIDAGLSFHNAPGWFEALRIEPQTRPLSELIPADAAIALTDSIRDPKALYDRFKGFVCSRARNGGQAKIADDWDTWEKRLIDDGSGLDELLGHLSGEQAVVLMPSVDASNPWSGLKPSAALILAIKDYNSAEKYLFEKFLPSKLGEPLREAEGGITSIVMHAGLEIHCAGPGAHDLGFALLKRAQGAVLIVGTLDAIKRIADASAGKGNVAALASWQTADKLLPEKSSLGVYMNGGGLIRTIGGYQNMFSFWEQQEEEDPLDRDDTDKDRDSIPFLAEFFRNTVVVGGAQSDETAVRVRMVAAGWPSRENMRGMIRHFRDVRRNSEVRDDFLQLREAAFTYYAIKGKPPTDLGALVKLGYAREESVTLDPFGEPEPRPYLLAVAPDTVDSRQAILLAYQSKPGLRGNHLAILWNSHVVELKPDELAEAIARAAKGEALRQDRYKVAEEALFKADLSEAAVVEEVWEARGVQVAVIDDEGNEEPVEVEAGAVREATERILDEKDAPEAD